MLGAGCRRVSVSVLPRALTPATFFASSAANDPVRGSSARSIARSNAAAVTGSFDGGEKRKPSTDPERVREPVGGDGRLPARHLGLEPRPFREGPVRVVVEHRARGPGALEVAARARGRWSRGRPRPPAAPRRLARRVGGGAAGALRWTLTQTRPCATVTPCGAAPTSTVDSTRIVCGSIRSRVPLRLFATHTAPSPDRDAGGPAPDRDGVGDRGGARVDPRDRVVLRVRDPHGAALRPPGRWAPGRPTSSRQRRPRSRGRSA